MSNNQLGNNLLYLLSEKKSLKWRRFKQYAEYLCRQDKFDKKEMEKSQTNLHSKALNPEAEDSFQKQSNYFWSLARELSAMAYLDIEGKTGEKVFKITAPILAELPFTRPAFLLTGARSPELLKVVKDTAKKCSRIDVEIKTHNSFPDTVILKPESKVILQTCLKNTSFQGDKLPDYIRISKNSPPAWSILEFAGCLKAYNESLKNDRHSGDQNYIKEIFDVKSLKFKTFDSNKDSLENDFSLVKIFHQEHFSKYYLFSKQSEDRVEVQPDWGKFLILAKQSKRSVLEYNKRTFELRSSLRLPPIFERGLTLLSGDSQKMQEKQANKKKKRQKQSFVFKKVPYEIAKIVSEKLEQNLTEI